MKKSFVLALFTVFSLWGCNVIPAVPPYPYEDPAKLNAEAKTMSDNLEAYINDWFAGKVPAAIPHELMPPGIIDSEHANPYLCNPDTLKGEDQFGARLALDSIDQNACQGWHGDTHCTYLVGGGAMMYLPFGHRVEISGSFPYCRFFSMQMTPPFNPYVYYAIGSFGATEVPIVDVDIQPLPGHVNPFRAGANRMATNRNYKVSFTMAMGNQAQMMPNLKPPTWRQNGTPTLYGSGLVYGGPWQADPNYLKRDGKWDVGQLWIRNYGMDKGKMPYGGVPLPKLAYYTPSGQKYYLHSDFSKWHTNTNKHIAAPYEDPTEINDKSLAAGWVKQFSIFGVIADGYKEQYGLDWDYIRNLHLGVTGMGETQPAPGCWGNSASCGNHINYLCKSYDYAIGAGKVMTMTGQMPTYPNTRPGLATMPKAEMRYWSITFYETGFKTDPPGINIISIMDDEVLLNSQRKYVICYSRANERPSNATSSVGVTWIDWGKTASKKSTVRWISVSPDWTFAKSAQDDHLPWSQTVLSGFKYDPNVLNVNNHTSGFLKWYQPVVSYMTKERFEQYGATVNPDSITPGTVCGTPLAGAATRGWMVALPLLIAMLCCTFRFAYRQR